MPWQALLDFWFGPLTGGVADADKRANWYASDPKFDAACTQFSPLLQQIRDGGLDTWRAEPEGRLAYIILCDQLPRNIFRGTAQAFAFDDLALAAARQGVEAAQDLQLELDQRAFFYMPFEHAESYVDQHTAVGLFSQLRDDAPSEHRSLFGNTLRFAQKHRDIILEFGRFPHRNPVLGRASTPAEIEFAAASDGFGQSTK